MLAWVAAGLATAFIAVVFLDGEYDLGILDRSDAATSQAVDAPDDGSGVGDSAQSPQPTSAPIESQQKPNTTLDPDTGWESGACVNESSIGTVSLVSCALSHDGEVVSTPTVESLCPDRTTHSVDLDKGVACLVLYWADGFNAEHCTFNGMALYGSVYLAETGDFYDVMVDLTESSYLADLEVVAVDYSYEANQCGLWHFVDTQYEADFTVAVGDSAYLADFTIAVAESEREAGT